MFDLEKMCEVIDSYNSNFNELKRMHECVKKSTTFSSEMQMAIQNFEEILRSMEEVKILLKQTQILCEISEGRNKATSEELEELTEMLAEF